MNFNLSSCGFSSGDLNPNCSEEQRLKISERTSGDRNLMKNKHHTEETKNKISNGISGDKNPFYGKKHTEETKNIMSEKALNREVSENTKNKIKQNHKNGMYDHIDRGNNFRGKSHSIETLEKMKIAHSKIKNKECVYCGLVSKPQLISRWHNENCKHKNCSPL